MGALLTERYFVLRHEYVNDLTGFPVAPHDRSIPAAAKHDVRIERGGRKVAEFESTRRVPVAITDFAEVAAVRHGDRSAVLLRGEHVIRKSIVRDHVIELTGRLVVPAAPALACVDADDCALIDACEKTLRIVPIDPEQ